MKAVVKDNKAYCPRCEERDYRVIDVKEAGEGAVKYFVRCKCEAEFEYCKTVKIGHEKVFTESDKEGETVQEEAKNYITAEQFLEQPQEVRDIFLKWWNPSVGDLFNFPEIDNQDCREVECICSKNRLKTINLSKVVPLLTEGQLRNFIEDKAGKKITILELDNDHWNIVSKYGFIKITNETNLIQAYWQAAIQVAKESTKHE